MDFLKKISGGLKKTSENFSSGLENIFNKSKPAQDVIQELEDFMISSDISLSLTEKIINNIKGINRVVYDVTSKPPSTIELE